MGGILLGLGCTVLVMPLATSMLTAVEPIDPVILVASATLLVTIGLAAVLPRAGRITDSAYRVLRHLGEA